MIALDLAIKSILRSPKPNIAAMIALISVLVPTMLLWSMKVGFIQSMLDELRTSPASLEIRVKGGLCPDARKAQGNRSARRHRLHHADRPLSRFPCVRQS